MKVLEIPCVDCGGLAFNSTGKEQSVVDASTCMA